MYQTIDNKITKTVVSIDNQIKFRVWFRYIYRLVSCVTIPHKEQSNDPTFHKSNENQQHTKSSAHTSI